MLKTEDLSKLTTEQIKKMTENLNKEVDDIKTRLKKPIFDNFIDKNTKIDDLLRQNIALQKTLIEQVHISNKLALATYYKEGITSVAPTDPYSVDTSILERLKVSDDDYKTLVENTGNTTITGSGKILELAGSGIMAECKFKSSNATINNSVYGVRIMSDNNIVYQDTWANFFIRSFHEVDLSCWQDVPNACYILVFQKIAFAKTLIIEVYGSTASFTDIYIKYHLKV